MSLLLAQTTMRKAHVLFGRHIDGQAYIDVRSTAADPEGSDPACFMGSSVHRVIGAWVHGLVASSVHRFIGSMHRFVGWSMHRFIGSSVQIMGSSVHGFIGSSIRRVIGSWVRRFVASSVYRFIGIWQQESGIDHCSGTVQRTAYPTYPSYPLPLESIAGAVRSIDGTV